MVCGNESTPTGKLGARFAKWRAVITIGDARPSRNAIVANAHALARYAALCQESGLVPIVEPEVLRDGIHDLDRCHGVTGDVLAEVFAQLDLAGVDLGAMVLKPSMVLPGSAAPPASIEAVAAATMDCLRSSVPTTVAGVAFLSGRQTPSVATEHLATMVRRGPTLGRSRSRTAGPSRTTCCATGPNTAPTQPLLVPLCSHESGPTPKRRSGDSWPWLEPPAFSRRGSTLRH